MRRREIGGLTTYFAKEYATPSPPAGTLPSSKEAPRPRGYLRHKASSLALSARVPTRCFSMVQRCYCHCLCNTVQGKESTSRHCCGGGIPPEVIRICRWGCQCPERPAVSSPTT